MGLLVQQWQDGLVIRVSGLENKLGQQLPMHEDVAGTALPVH
jgi:hypothetical protein